LLLWVFLPSLLSLIVVCSSYLRATGSLASFRDISDVSRLFLPLLIFGPLIFGPGVHYSLIGVVLVGTFALRLAAGRASLPLALPKASLSASDDPTSWHRVELFLVVVLALSPAFLMVFPFTNFVYYLTYSQLAALQSRGTIAFSAGVFTFDAIMVVIAIWMMGREAWNPIRRSIRCPTAVWFGLAIAFPFGIGASISIAQFLLRFLQWFATQPNQLGPPHLGSYFHLPSIGVFSLLLAAFSEEIIFRGLLQPRFLRRYGLFRGLFLLGIVFAGAHFGQDFSVGFTDGLVLLRLCLRLIESLALSFVFGWLTLRSGSVFPAAVAHGLFNVLGSFPLGPDFLGIGPVIYLMFALLAALLFRRWPIPAEFVEDSVSPVGDLAASGLRLTPPQSR
jgi:membrane protease YdiL (CAAX protease family)